MNQQNRNNEFHQGEKRGFTLPLSSSSSISIDTSKEKDKSKKYWDFMREIRLKIFYLDFYVDCIYIKDRNIKMLCALVSSASIAAWTIWKKWAFIWSIIIAIFQVVNVVKEYLHYDIILKNIQYSEIELKRLYNKIECNWFQIKSGEFSEEEVNELLYDLKEKYIEIESKCFEGGPSLFEKEKIYKKAEEKTNLYFQEDDYKSTEQK